MLSDFARTTAMGTAASALVASSPEMFVLNAGARGAAIQWRYGLMFLVRRIQRK